MAQLGNNAIVPGFDDGKDAGISIILERVEAEAHCLKVHLAGRIDTYNSTYFQRSSDLLLSSGFYYLVFCCASLGYVSSAGIGAFTQIHESAKAVDGAVFLVYMQPQVYEVFNILGYTNYLSFRETAEEAIENLRVSAELRALTPGRFPLAFSCPHCSSKLKTMKPGKFICSTCKIRLVVNEGGRVKIWSASDAP
jgi:anti-anti-sigma factor